MSNDANCADRCKQQSLSKICDQPSQPAPQLKTQAGRQDARIAVKVTVWTVFLDVNELIAVEADGNYVVLHLNSRSYFLRESISTMEAQLAQYGFLRVNRSVLVNSAAVEGIKPSRAGEYLLRLIGGKQHSVTRTYKDNLRSLAELWIGARCSTEPGVSTVRGK